MMMKLTMKSEILPALVDGTLKSIWNSPVGSLKGVGPKTVDILEKMKINTIADALFHFPKIGRAHV